MPSMHLLGRIALLLMVVFAIVQMVVAITR
jgi:hypothetical protein